MRLLGRSRDLSDRGVSKAATDDAASEALSSSTSSSGATSDFRSDVSFLPSAGQPVHELKQGPSDPLIGCTLLVFLLAMHIPILHHILALRGQVYPFVALLAEDTMCLNVARQRIILQELDAFGLRLPGPGA